MAEYSRFFDSTPEDERYYTADEFAEYFRRLLTDGIFNGGTNLQVSATGKDIRTYVQPGYAWIQGYMYKVAGDPIYLTHDLPDPTLDRIDRIVLRLDTSLNVRAIQARVIKGVPSATPQPPAIVRDGNIFDISLAQVKVEAGKSYIEAYQIADERLNNSVCGLVNSLIQADTTEIFNQFQNWYNSKTVEFKQQWDDWLSNATSTFGGEWTTWFNNIKAEWQAWFNQQVGAGYLTGEDLGVTVETPTGAQSKVDLAEQRVKNYADTTSTSPTRILSQLLKVDGPGSGLDADTLDGLHANSFLRISNVITGSYVGDGNASRTIDLGTTPIFVIVYRLASAVVGDYNLAFIGAGVCVTWDDYGPYTYSHIVDGGFLIGTSGINLNIESKTYNYIAIK